MVFIRLDVSQLFFVYLKSIIKFTSILDDFKPVSVDSSKTALLDVGQNNQVTITAPNAEGSGTSETVFKGSRKPHQKECVLIINHETGEITLEKLSQNIIVKKTREHHAQKGLQTNQRPNTPVESKKSVPLCNKNKPNTFPNSKTSQNLPKKNDKLSPPKTTNSNYIQPNNKQSQPISPSMPILFNTQIDNSSSSSSSTANNAVSNPIANTNDAEMLELSESSSDSSESDNDGDDSSSSSSSSGSSSSSDDFLEKNVNLNPPSAIVNNLDKKINSDRRNSSDSEMEFEAGHSLNNFKSNHFTNNMNGTSSSVKSNELLSMPKFSQLSKLILICLFFDVIFFSS